MSFKKHRDSCSAMKSRYVGTLSPSLRHSAISYAVTMVTKGRTKTWTGLWTDVT